MISTILIILLSELLLRKRKRMINDSFFGGFILLGFTGQPQMEMIISWVVFFFYIIALIGNMAIILLSFLDDYLQNPMYSSLEAWPFWISVIPQT